MKTTISSRGQIVLPAEMCQADGIEPGDEFEAKRVEPGAYLLRRVHPARNQGLLQLLLDCPVKDWFQPAARTETTDDIPPPDRGGRAGSCRDSTA